MGMVIFVEKIIVVIKNRFLKMDVATGHKKGETWF
jgi:hypothetical protein